MEHRVLLSVTGLTASHVSAVVGVPTPIDLATFSDGVATDPTKYGVSVNYGDGTTVATSANDTNLRITNTGAGAFIVTDVHAFPEPTVGTDFTIQVTVNETGTANTNSSSSTATVSDGTLAIDLGPKPFTFTGTVGTFSDVDLNATAKDFTGLIQWGDGNTSPAVFTKNAQGGFSVSGAHTFAAEGSYRLHVSVQNHEGSSIGLDNTVTVSGPPVIATGGVLVSGIATREITTQTLATFTDPGGTKPNASDPGGAYSAAVDWGDGTPPSVGVISIDSTPYTVSSSHVYSDRGAFKITVTIHHEGAVDAVVTSSASVLLLIPMFRAYNPIADRHVFMTSGGEFYTLVTHGLNDETFAGFDNRTFNVLDRAASGSLPIHRLYNPNGGQHYLTTSDGERDVLLGAGWSFEKDEGFVYPTNATPGTAEVFLLYNSKTGDHLYTTSPVERDSIASQFSGIWTVQTSLGFGYLRLTPLQATGDTATLGAQTRAETAVAPVGAASLSGPLGTETLRCLPVPAQSSSSTATSGSAGGASPTDTAPACAAACSPSEPTAIDDVFSSSSWIDSVNGERGA